MYLRSMPNISDFFFPKQANDNVLKIKLFPYYLFSKYKRIFSSTEHRKSSGVSHTAELVFNRLYWHTHQSHDNQKLCDFVLGLCTRAHARIDLRLSTTIMVLKKTSGLVALVLDIFFIRIRFPPRSLVWYNKCAEGTDANRWDTVVKISSARRRRSSCTRRLPEIFRTFFSARVQIAITINL